MYYNKDMKTFTQETRNKMSQAAKRRCTSEWRKKKSEEYATKLPFEKVQALYESGLTQREVDQRLGVSQKVIWAFMKRNGIKARVAAKRDQRGIKNSNWKGNGAGYQACHARVIAARGHPSKCEECGTTDPNQHYDWANLTGNYHDVNDYRRLCRSCHWKLDKTILNLQGERKKCPHAS